MLRVINFIRCFGLCLTALAALTISHSTSQAQTSADPISQSPSEKQALPSRAGEGMTLRELRQRADVHPEVRMLEAEAEATRKRISMRTSLMDPMITLGVENLPTDNFRFDQDAMTSSSIAIGQAIPFPGKLAAARSAELEQVRAVEERVKEKRNALRREVTRGFFDLYPLQKRIEAYERHFNTLDEIARIVSMRLETGSSSQQDMIRVELRRIETESAILRERSMLRMRQAEIMRVTGEGFTRIETPSELTLIPVPYSLDELDSMASRNSPTLELRRALIEKYRKEEERTRLDRYPDVDLMLMYMHRSELAADSPMNPGITSIDAHGSATSSSMAMPLPDMLSFRVSFNLPLGFGNKQNDAEDEMAAMRRMQEEDLRAMQLETRAMLAGKLAELDALSEQLEFMRIRTLPLLELSLQTAVVNFANSKTDLVTILSSELDLIHRSEEAFQLAADYHKTIADIEYLTGVEFIRE